MRALPFLASMVVGAITLVVAPLARAGCPYLPESTGPERLLVVGRMADGRSDEAGRATITLRRVVWPMANVQVELDFSQCCDLRVCASMPGYDCATKKLRGVSDGNGEFSFVVLGAAAAEDHAGCGGNTVIVRVGCHDDPPTREFWRITAAVLDQDGASGGSSGTTVSDVATLLHLFGQVALGGPYRGRGDIDGDGAVTMADVAALFGHVGRLALAGGIGCGGPLCTGACP